MLTSPRRTLLLILTLILGCTSAFAADTRFQHVSLLAARDRVSLVFELTGEPQDVATRRVSAAVLELDAGPVIMPARPTSFMAPPGVRFVMGVSIQGGDGTAGRLKARITLVEHARSAVRVAGNRVYVDFSSDVAPEVQQPQRTAKVTAPNATPKPTASTTTPAAPVAPAASAQARDKYRTVVEPVVVRFDELTPFLLSATASPSEPVLKAIGSTLVGMQGLLLSVDVPAESKPAHDLLSSAVAAAVTSVNPTFAGDRIAQAKQALGLLTQAKAGW